MGYRKVGWLEQCWYVVKYVISTKLKGVTKKSRR